MQERSVPNRVRSETTQAALIAAARGLFAENGFAETSTPEIVAAAGVTRGALYHHFEDKLALFAAVLEKEAATVAAQIDQRTASERSPLTALQEGAAAYFAAMAVVGRARLLLVEGPAVLGTAAMDQIDERTGRAELRTGLAYAMEEGHIPRAPLDALAAVLSAAFDRAALAIAWGEPAADQEAAIACLLEGLFAKR